MAEQNLPIDEFVRRAVAEAVVEEFKFPMIEYAVKRGT